VEIVVGVGGEDVGGVSRLTSEVFFSGSVFKFMTVAAIP
jgi:hypothetical protein